MSIVGILAYRSALADSAPMAVPDFRREQDRKACETDDWSPDPTRRKDGQPLPSVKGHIEPDQKAAEFAHRVWKEVGYE